MATSMNCEFDTSGVVTDQLNIMSESESKTSPHPSDPTDETEPSAKRLKRDASPSEIITVSSSSGPSQTDDSSVNSLSLLPLQTHLWEAKHLDNLHIVPSHSPSDPVSLLKDGLKSILGPEKYIVYLENKANDPVISDVRFCIASALDHIKLDIEDLRELDISGLETLKADLKNWKDQYSYRRPSCADFYSVVELHGQRFADQLRYVLSYMNSNNGSKVPLEGMYQQLFLILLEMFGLKAYGFSNIWRQSLKIGEKTVRSRPDILVMDYKNIRYGLEVSTHRMLLAVVDVKRDVQKREQSITLQRRSAGNRNVCKRNRATEEHNHSAESISQHGGNLLCHLPASVFGPNGIFGILVQDSMVSFTSLIPPENYLRCLSGGSYRRTQADLNISQGFNVLSKEGREKLFLPLMELYSLQRILDLHHESIIPDL